MKLFFNLSILKRIATIIGAAIIIFILFLIITTLNARSFQVDETVKEIFVGDSHIRYAFDDNLDINTLNMGSSSESTYFTYFKLFCELVSWTQYDSILDHLFIHQLCTSSHRWEE